MKKFECELCEDTGIVYDVEWTGTDDSYEVERPCRECNDLLQEAMSLTSERN